MVLDAIVPETDADKAAEPQKNIAAVMLGRLGGLKGGPARAKMLSKKQLSDSAKKAARARWSKTKKPKGGQAP